MGGVNIQPFMETIGYPYHLLPFFAPQTYPHAIEIHPKTARQLGVGDGSRVDICTPYGEARAQVRYSTRLHPSGIVLPLHQGDTDFLNLLGGSENETGGLAFLATPAQLVPSSGTKHA